MLLLAILVIKMNILKRFSKILSDNMTLSNYNDQILYFDTLTSARPLGVVINLACQAWVSTTPLGSSRCLCIVHV